MPAPRDVHPRSSRGAHAGRRRFDVTVLPSVVLLMWGAVERLLSVTGYFGSVDADQSVVGLMARHIAHGQFTTFFWAQPYGGSADAFVLAPFVALAPGNPVMLRAAALIESVALTWVIWRIVLRSLRRDHAFFVAAATFAFPAYSASFSTHEMLFYVPTVLLGTLLLLFTMRMVERPGDWRDPVVWGLALGIGWWTSPVIVVYAAVSVAWLAWNYRRVVLVKSTVLAVPAVSVGAVPWIYFNLAHHPLLASLHNQPVVYTYAEHAHVLLSGGMPTIFGLRAIPYQQWIVPGPLGVIIAITLGLLLLWQSIVLLRSASPLPLVVCSGMVVIVAIPLSYSVGTNGRYDYYIAPIVVAILFSAFRSLALRWLAVLLVVVSAVAALNVEGAFKPGLVRTISHLGRGANASDLQVAATLERWNVTRLYADYWTAYNVDFFSDERLAVVPFDADRYRPYDKIVEASADPSYLFPPGSARPAWLEARLRQMHVPFSVAVPAAGYTLITPARRVLPGQLGISRSLLSEGVPASRLPPPNRGA